tara:strand:+ start:95 stop:469 length:375 start_codon:yes stop_codon:yes gene_type:complete
MPRKVLNTAVVEESPVEIEEIEEIEVQPKKHIVKVWKRQPLPEYSTHIDVPVGEIIYWESTDDITYSFEVGHQIYMDNFVTRAIQVGHTWIPSERTKEWFENLPLATFEEGYFAGEVLTLDEIE